MPNCAISAFRRAKDVQFSAFLCLVFGVCAGFVGLLAHEPAATTARTVFGILLLMGTSIFAGSLFGREEKTASE